MFKNRLTFSEIPRMVQKQSWIVTGIWLFFSCAVALSLALWLFRETPHGLFRNGIPLAGDGAFTGIFIKLIVNSTWRELLSMNIVSNQYGWPGELNFASYPIGNFYDVLAIKAYSTITQEISPNQILHFFSISKAIPIAASSFVLGRTLNLSRFLSALLGVVFSTCNFNLVRAEGHFFLGLTWSIPLMLSAIYLAYKIGQEGRRVTTRELSQIAIYLSLSFLTGFYYLTFASLICISVIVLFFCQAALEKDLYSLIEKLKKAFLKSRFLIIVLASFALGIFLQAGIAIMRSQHILGVAQPADRSPVESIVYSGNLESLFFDLNNQVLKVIGRPDLVAFLQSRISWEGSQIGTVAGLFLFGLLIYPFVLIFLGKPNKQLWTVQLKNYRNQLLFSKIVLATSLLLYLPTPFNFAISRLLPQIRAWGRLSVFIVIIAMVIIFILINSRFLSSAITLVVLSSVVLLSTFDYYNFRNARPQSFQLNSAYRVVSEDNKLVVNQLSKLLPKKCAIVNLPLYPFPEFDRSDDEGLDYGLFDVSLEDKAFFKWTYGGIKATQNYKAWQLLVSEFPPFNRASLQTQLEYGASSGACAGLLDTRYLNKSEQEERLLLSKKFPECFANQDRTSDGNIIKYEIIFFEKPTCSKLYREDFKSAFERNVRGNLVWRIDSTDGLGYHGLFQTFSKLNHIDVRYRIGTNSVGETFMIEVLIDSKSLKKIENPKLCFYFLGKNQEEQCQNLINISPKYWSMQFPEQLIQPKIQKVRFFLRTSNEIDIEKWGILLSQN